MFPEPPVSKHSASLTGTITVISEGRGREARPHKLSLKESQLLLGLGARTLVGIQGWGCLFCQMMVENGKRFSIKFHPIQPTFECPLWQISCEGTVWDIDDGAQMSRTGDGGRAGPFLAGGS